MGIKRTQGRTTNLSGKRDIGRKAMSGDSASISPASSGYQFRPEERPAFPGAPYSPRHSPAARILYGMAAFVMAMASGLGNGLLTVNVTNMAGYIGVYTYEVFLLVAVYVAFNATANLLLVKARVQFGIIPCMHVLLGGVIAAQVLQIAIPSFGLTVLARAMSGIAAGGLTTLTLHNLFQAIPLRHRPAAIVIGFTLPQLAVPVARLIPLDAIAPGEWQGLHLIELALALAAWAIINLVPLPPTERQKAFEPLDALTVSLAVPGMMLLCIVLAEGRFFWWSDTPWIGWALTAALPLLWAVLQIEDRRKRPLLQVHWYANRDIFIFALIGVVFRIALTEQTYAAVGLLSLGGLTSDQLHPLFAMVLIAMIAGVAVTAVVARPHRLFPMSIAAALLIAAGSWIDSNATTQTRPQQLFLSQSLLGFGSILFLGTAIQYGLSRVIERGPPYLVSFVVLFSTTQNLGGLAGSALLGTIQMRRTRFHAERLAENIAMGHGELDARLAQSANLYHDILIDPVQQTAQGNAVFGNALQLQANILAFNDTFRVVTWIALAAAIFLSALIVSKKFFPMKPSTHEARA